jgi:tRNA-specific 2-thiouridylase
MTKNVLLAMSGGVDSSIAGYLLKEQGYNIIGATLKTYSDKSNQFNLRKSERNIIDAKIIAQKLKIPHYVIDVETEFENKIIRYFTDNYLIGQTPNPCVVCNPLIKFKYLFELSEQFDCEYIATGHYVVKKLENGRYYLSKAMDDKKDQVFFLWNLPQNYLQKTIFPLGKYKKKEIFEIAHKLGYNVLTEKSESFGVCFLGKNNYHDFIENYIGKPNLETEKGNFINIDNQIIGEHSGKYKYTIGQKLNINNQTFYVILIDNESKNITIGEKEKLFKSQLEIENINLQKYCKIEELKEFEITNSYYNKPVKAKILSTTDKILIKTFEPVYAPAKGQSIVLYECNDLIGGGFIKDFYT